jgi:hypothetical protein
MWGSAAKDTDAGVRERQSGVVREDDTLDACGTSRTGRLLRRRRGNGRRGDENGEQHATCGHRPLRFYALIRLPEAQIALDATGSTSAAWPAGAISRTSAAALSPTSCVERRIPSSIASPIG